MENQNIGRMLLRVTQFSLLVILLLLFTFNGLSFLKAYHIFYNEGGRYFDEESSLVYHEQSVLGYGFSTFILFLLLIWVGKWILNTKRKAENNLPLTIPE